MHDDPSRAISPPLRALGIICLVMALAAAFVLALDHFALAHPPGCGPQSGCDRATRSAWGTIPGIDWPVSLLGVAYFGGLLAAWLASSRSIYPLLRMIAWLGGLASFVLIGVMLSHGYVCKYCLATHVGNLLFVIVMEIAARHAARSNRSAPLIIGVATFIILTSALAVAHVQTNARRLARDEAARKASLAQIQQAATRDAGDASSTSTTAVPIENGKPLTGRWRLGPENAPIRIVMFTDYQCPDCRAMESQVMAVLQRHPNEVSLSVKHFPMSSDCNRHINVNMHANACWAARAAETAGMLRGNDGFWQMHHWLFEHGGSFTDADFPPSLQQLGYDPQQFIQTMTSQRPLDLVEADIEEGADLGLFLTPMIFINGVELRGFIGNPNALVRSVDDLAATHPRAGSPLQDRPPRAAAKYVEDWATWPIKQIPAAANPHVMGNASDSAKVKIVVWGDYQDPFTAELDRAIREQIAAGHDIRYEFRAYPADQSCNPNVQMTPYPFGCMAARAAGAAAALGGNDAYWKMHDWLLAHQTPLNDDLLRQGAQAAGVDPAALLAKMNEPSIASALNQDLQRAAPFIEKGFIPSLYVNGRWAPRWKLESEKILERIVQRAEAQ